MLDTRTRLFFFACLKVQLEPYLVSDQQKIGYGVSIWVFELSLQYLSFLAQFNPVAGSRLVRGPGFSLQAFEHSLTLFVL